MDPALQQVDTRLNGDGWPQLYFLWSSWLKRDRQDRTWAAGLAHQRSNHWATRSFTLVFLHVVHVCSHVVQVCHHVVQVCSHVVHVCSLFFCFAISLIVILLVTICSKWWKLHNSGCIYLISCVQWNVLNVGWERLRHTASKSQTHQHTQIKFNLLRDRIRIL